MWKYLNKILRVNNAKQFIERMVFISAIPFNLPEISLFQRFLYYIYATIINLIAICYLICCLASGIDALFAENLDLIKIAFTLCFPLVHISTPFRSLKFLINQTEIYQLFQIQQSLNTKYITNHLYMEQTRKIEETYFFRICGNFVVFIEISFLLTLLGFLISDVELNGYQFPFLAYVPQSLPIPVVKLFCSVGCFTIATQTITHDCIAVYLIVALSGHCRILGFYLNELKLKQRNFNVNTQGNIRKLKECISYHYTIIFFKKKFEEFYKIILLIYIVLVVFIFGLGGFMIAVYGFSDDRWSVGVHCSCVLFQVLIYCYAGQKLIDESEQIFCHAYNTEWFLFGRIFGQFLMVFKVNCINPLEISCLFFALSFKTFGNVISKSYTFLAVFKESYSN